jgi:hypothetical protein
MTTVHYHYSTSTGLVFVEWGRTNSADPVFAPPTTGLSVSLTRWVCRVSDWDTMYLPLNIDYRQIEYPAWADRSRSIWESLVPMQLRSTPSTPIVAINYNSLELFTALCGDEKIVKKVIK